MHHSHIAHAIDLAVENVRSGRGGPFGAVVVRGDEIIATGTNLVTSTADPTAHAEVIAIREACRRLGTHRLVGCSIYASCEPCPMCLGAIYWAHLDTLHFAASRHDAAVAGFDDEMIYQELALPIEARRLPTIHAATPDAMKPFDEWRRSEGLVEY